MDGQETETNSHCVGVQHISGAVEIEADRTDTAYFS